MYLSSRREFLRIAGVGATGLLAAACQPQVVKETVVVKEEVEKIVEKEVIVEKVKDTILLRWHHRLGTEWDMFASAITAYKDIRPEVIVHEEVVPASGYEFGPKLVTIIAGGMGGDIAWMANGSGSFQFFAMNEALLSLEPLVASDGTGWSLDEYFPQAIDMFRMSPEGVGPGGTLFALPELAQTYPNFNFFNRDLFQEKGVPEPNDDWTREDLLEHALQMTDDDIYGFLPNWANFTSMRMQMLPYGVELITADRKNSRLNEPEVQFALRWLFDLFTKHKVAPTAQAITGNSLQMFLGQRLAMIQHYIYPHRAAMIGDAFDFDMVLMPKGPSGSRGQAISGDGEGILKQSKNVEIAYEFIKLLTDKERQLLLVKEINLGSRPDSYEDPSVQQPWVQRQYQMLQTAADYLGPYNFRKQEINQLVAAMFGPAANGEVDVDDAFFAEKHEEFQKSLDKPREGVS